MEGSCRGTWQSKGRWQHLWEELVFLSNSGDHGREKARVVFRLGFHCTCDWGFAVLLIGVLLYLLLAVPVCVQTSASPSPVWMVAPARTKSTALSVRVAPTSRARVVKSLPSCAAWPAAAMQTAASMTLSLVCPCVFAVPAIHRVRGDWLWLWLNVALCECVVLHCLFCILLRFSVLYMWCQLACSVFLTRLPLADTFFFFLFYTGRKTPIYLLVFF